MSEKNLLQSVKQRQTTSMCTVGTHTYHFTAHKEGSSVQLEAVLGKSILQAGYIFLNAFHRGLCCLAALMY